MKKIPDYILGKLKEDFLLFKKTMEMNREEFEKHFLGEFKADPQLQATIEFLRTHNPAQISAARKSGLLTNDMYRLARQIIEKENSIKR